ncbi:MAG TPA: hypothetical protein VGJ02_11260 [Pyrinomonadaceae bacterium]|jgi:hypothetical protein
MKASFFYFLTTVFGLIGTLSVLRTIELLALGGGPLPVQFLIAIVMLTLAGACLKKARARALEH